MTNSHLTNTIKYVQKKINENNKYTKLKLKKFLLMKEELKNRKIKKILS